jgi:hypothetical protein
MIMSSGGSVLALTSRHGAAPTPGTGTGAGISHTAPGTGRPAQAAGTGAGISHAAPGTGRPAQAAGTGANISHAAPGTRTRPTLCPSYLVAQSRPRVYVSRGRVSCMSGVQCPAVHRRPCPRVQGPRVVHVRCPVSCSPSQAVSACPGAACRACRCPVSACPGACTAPWRLVSARTPVMRCEGNENLIRARRTAPPGDDSATLHIPRQSRKHPAPFQASRAGLRPEILTRSVLALRAVLRVRLPVSPLTPSSVQTAEQPNTAPRWGPIPTGRGVTTQPSWWRACRRGPRANRGCA